MTLPVGFGAVQLSPDGRTALVTDGRTRVLQIDLSRRIPMRVDVGAEQIFSARWHPDGRRAALGGNTLRLLDLDSREQEVLVDDVRGVRNPSFTRDGTAVAFTMAAENSSQSIYALLPGEMEPRPIVSSNRQEHSPALSPDGRWIAYGSHESGEAQVYIAGFPENDERQQLTADGGWEPFWSRDGRELFFTEGDAWGERVLRVVSVSSGDRLELGEPRTLFVLNDLTASASFEWGAITGPAHDISPDGERFLMIRQPAAPPATEIIIVENWLDELERLVP